ncbi:MAG: Fic family protein, partial [Chloroflexi bacterium]|nr:Fic family protein [Chloroflexota bacterium]
MILFELVRGNEDHPAYRALEVANGGRHYDFLQSVVETAVAVEKPFLWQTVIKAINYHAIACLHPYAGEYRPCAVTVGDHDPPDHYRVDALMDDFVNEVNRYWNDWDEVSLAAYVLWRLNWIHPFINGNGRTARAACYF